jgi:hypothetical protein
MENIFLRNVHFVLFDNWFINLTEKEQDFILENTPGIEKYLGIELQSETFDEEKGFEFKIVNKERWDKAKEKHDFIKDL